MENYSYSITVNSKDIAVNNRHELLDYRCDVPIRLWRDSDRPQKIWQMALVNMTCYNSVRNISAALHNNFFSYKLGTGAWHVVTMPDGTYTVDDINNFLYLTMVGNGSIPAPNPSNPVPPEYNPINMYANATLGKVEVILYHVTTGQILIDWRGRVASGAVPAGGDSKFRFLIGYNDTIVDSFDGPPGAPGANFVSDFAPDMTAGIYTFNVRLSCVSGGQHNGVQSSTIYSFTPNVPPGKMIEVRPYVPMFLDVNVAHMLSGFQITLVDNEGRLLDLSGEPVTYHFHLKYAEVA